MSLLDSIKPLSLKIEEKKEDVVPVSKKQYIVISSKDITPSESDRFTQFGKLLVWDDHLTNVPFDKLEFDYLLIDIRSKEARVELGRCQLDLYEIVCYVSFYEKSEYFVQQILKKNEKANIITSIPKKSINKADFDLKLLDEKLISPSLVKQVAGYLFRCFLHA